MKRIVTPPLAPVRYQGTDVQWNGHIVGSAWEVCEVLNTSDAIGDRDDVPKWDLLPSNQYVVAAHKNHKVVWSWDDEGVVVEDGDDFAYLTWGELHV